MHCIDLSLAPLFAEVLDARLQRHHFGRGQTDDFATFSWAVAEAAIVGLRLEPVRDAAMLASMQADLYLAYTGRIYLDDNRLRRAYDHAIPA